MKYRSEIDGLRAIAVFPVILFHAGFELFNGGFVGVDIFFVISGYLITSIIINELEEGNFSLAKFYERRVRRIFPALFFVVFACIPFAWMWLTPLDMKEFSKSLIAVATFSSNILFWKESGYFDTEAELKPLLHTWSLAVEEQYYIIFPVFLILSWKLGRKFVITALVVIFLASLATAHWGSYHKPYATFYLLPTRVWELLLGAFCAFILNRNPSINTYTSQYGSIIGLTLITVAVFMFSSSTPTPSLFTLFPTVGAALIILFARNGNFVAKLLSTKIMIGLGLLSYSIYLWHQPIFAFARHRSTEPLSNFIYLMLCVLTIFLAFLTWKYIENPFRDRDRIGKSRVFMISTISIILFFAIGASVHFDGVLTHRFDARAKEIISAESDRSGRHKVLGNVNSQIHSVLIGDSHANSLQDSLHSGLTKIGTAMTIETVGGCPPVYGLIRHDLDYGDKCHRRYKDIYQKILKDPYLRLILVSARFTLYLETTRFDNGRGGIEKGASDNVLYDTIEYGDRIRPLEERKKAVRDALFDGLTQLADSGREVLIVGPIPEVGWNAPKKALLNYLEGNKIEVLTDKEIYDERNSFAIDMLNELSKHSNISVIYPHDFLCDEMFCRATFEGLPLYYDTNHLSVRGTKYLLEKTDLFTRIKNGMGG